MLWQRFSERSTKVVFYAQEEAVRRARKSVASEHLLLGLLRDMLEDERIWPPAPLGSAFVSDFARVLLQDAGVDFDQLCAEAERQEALANPPDTGSFSLTASAKKIVDYAYEEAREAKASHITTDFLLLALARDNKGSAGRTLAQAGFDLETARQQVATFYLPAQTGRTNETVKPTLWSRLFAKRAAAPGEEEIR